MAVGRFDTPAEAQFMNTYSPIPFDEMLQAGLMRQQQYNQGQSFVDEAQVNAENIKYIPGSEDERYVTGTVLPTVKEIVDKYTGQDLSQPQVMRAISKELRGLDTQRVSRIGESRTAWDQAQATKRQLTAAGKYQPYLYDENVQDFSSEFSIYDRTPEQAVDYKEAAKKYFDNMPKQFLYESVINEQNGIMGMFKGVSKSGIKGRAAEGVDAFMGTTAGTQYGKYLASQGIAKEDIRAATQEFLVEAGNEFYGPELSGTYKIPQEDLTGGGNQQDFVNDQSLPFDLRTQPSSINNVAYKNLSKNAEAVQDDISELAGLRDVATENGRTQQAAQLQSQINKLQDDNSDLLYWSDHMKDLVDTQYNEDIQGIISGFGPSLQNNKRGVNISNNEQYALEQAFASVAEDGIYRGSQVSNSAAAGVIYQRAHQMFPDIISKNDVDIAMFGGGDVAYVVQQAYKNASKDLKSLGSRITSSMDKEWEAIRADGIVEETTSLPMVVTSADKQQFPVWNQFSNNLLTNALEDFEVDVVSSEGLSDRQRNNYIKDLSSYSDINFVSASESDGKKPYIYVTASNPTSAGGTERSEVGYKIYINKDEQNAAIGQTMIQAGDPYNGLKWMDPSISKTLEKSFSTNKRPNKVSISHQTGDINFVKSGDQGLYYLADDQGNIVNTEQAFYNKEDIKAAAYEIFGKRAGIIPSN